jgi:hypothetical protein
MFSSDRDDYRKVFFEAWRKHKEKQVLEPLEGQLVEIILMHPEYHTLLNDPQNNQSKSFDEENPFLHLSLHLGIREQVSTNRPAGIKQIYQALLEKYRDVLTVEHKMMEHLAKTLWDAQKNGQMPDESIYLEGFKKIA